MNTPSKKMPGERPAADFGARLRAARESRGIALRGIADATKISVRALEALERDDISQLPGGIFSRAFVRAYATEVGLDPEQTIADFITRFPDDFVTQGHPRTRALVDEVEREHRRERRAFTPFRLAVVGIPLLAAVAYFVFAVPRSTPVPVTAVAEPAPAAVLPAVAPAALTRDTPGAAAARLVVAIEALRPCTVTVSADGGSAARVELVAGATQQYTAARELLVSVSDPSAVRWTINGAAARPLTGPVRVASDTLAGLQAPQ